MFPRSAPADDVTFYVCIETQIIIGEGGRIRQKRLRGSAVQGSSTSESKEGVSEWARSSAVGFFSSSVTVKSALQVLPGSSNAEPSRFSCSARKNNPCLLLAGNPVKRALPLAL